MSSQVKKIEIGEAISYDLALRASASELFDHLEEMDERAALIDFSGVRSITRSFAHEYIVRKSLSKKAIDEVNVPENVNKMFKVVRSSGKKVRVLDMSSVRVLTL